MEIDSIPNNDYMEEDTPGELDNQTDVYYVASLIDELKHDDVQYRLNSVNKLNVIAEALGEDRTRDELIPFIHNGIATNLQN